VFEPDETVQIKYILRRRIKRSILTRKGQRVALVTTYLNVDWSNPDKFRTPTSFTNTASEHFDEIFIEDIIPMELIVVSTECTPEIPGLKLPTENSTAYRWTKISFAEKESIEIVYRFRKKQSARWFKRFMNFPEQKASTSVEKISQPMLVEGEGETYYLLYRFSSTQEIEFELQDKIPENFTILTTYPSWVRARIQTHSGWQILNWSIELETGQEQVFLMHIEGPRIFFPGEPVVKIKNYKVNSQEIKKKKELIKIDFRQYFS
ncbi:MAG: hypothetical protein ACFFBD_12845, partial [Candidatus Hodarchaeota archaeon]